MKKKLISVFLLLMFNLSIISYGQAAEYAGDEYWLFKDVPDNYWAADPINDLSSQYIIQGYPDNTFRPYENVTREQYAVLMFKTLKMNFPLRIKQPSFADVNEDRWSYAYIETVKSYFDSYPGSNGRQYFKPNQNATREEVASALVKALGYTPQELENKNILKEHFSDYSQISSKNQVYVALAVEKNLLSGFPNGTIQGKAPVTRAQTAAILRKVISTDPVRVLGPMLDVRVPETVTSGNLTITGVTEPGASVFINGKSVKVVDGKFSATYTLAKEDTYKYVISSEVVGKTGVTEITKTVKYELPKPVLTINPLPKITSSGTVSITGKAVSPDNIVKVDLNGKPLYVAANGVFSTTISLSGGENVLTFTAINGYGKTVKETRVINYDGSGLVLYVENVPESTTVQELRVLGQVTDKNDPYPQVYFNNKLIQQWEDGTFEIVTLLKKGSNTLTFKAVNRHGKTSTVTRTITFDNQLPVIALDEIPELVTTTRLTITGKVSDINDESPKLYLNKKLIAVDRDGSFKTSINLKNGENTLSFELVNSLGDVTVIDKKVLMAYPPVIKIDSKIPDKVTERSFYITGRVTDSNIYTVHNYTDITFYYNDRKLLLSPNGAFNVQVNLSTGENTLVFTATNKYGVSSTVTIKVTYTSPF